MGTVTWVPQLHTAAHIAGEYECSRSWVYMLAARGKIKTYRDGDNLLFDHVEVAAWILTRNEKKVTRQRVA